MTHTDYYIQPTEVIGEGCSKVVKAVHINTGEVRVAKLIDISANRQEMLQVFYNEAHVIQHLNSLLQPNIVQVHSTSINNNKAIIIMEKMNGDLLDLILEQTLTEPQKMNIFKQTCEAVRQCHDNGIAHLDIKPDNILVNIRGYREITVKLADFGGSQFVSESGMVSDVRGTIHYNAPEVFTQTKEGIDGKMADIWSLGILLHVLLTGTWPIQTNDPNELRKLLSKGELQLSPLLSNEHRTLISSLLTVNAKQRPSIHELLQNPLVNPNTKTKSSPRTQKSKKPKRSFFRRLSWAR